MTTMTPSRLGQINESGSTTALFLTVFAGEVLSSFEIACIMRDKVVTRSIDHGISAQFPVIGRTTSALYTPGTELLGNQINSAQRLITIDGLTVADTFIANIDEAMNHYDVRGIYSREMGFALARTMDSSLQQVVLLAARASATLADSGYAAGTVETNANYGTVGATLASGLFSAAQALDTNNAPEDERYTALRPAQYYLLAQTTAVLNKDWGGRGSYAEGKVFNVAGIDIKKSNLVPNTNVTTGPAAYQGNFSTTVAPVWHKGAAGLVTLMDLGMEAEYLIKYQGTLMVAKYATGYGILRPESAVELKTS
jgi:hypothetical protein